MAELVGLTASIIGIAGAGVKISTALYTFVGTAARADREISDIAGDVALTSNVLSSVGNMFKEKDAKSLASPAAIQDATSIIQRCETVFGEIEQVIEKRSKTRKDGKKGISSFGKLTWPLKEQRVELLRRRLDSLKTSLLVLLEVLRFASDRTKDSTEKQGLEEERERIRQLHRRQQESLENLAKLENKISNMSLGPNGLPVQTSTSFVLPATNSMVQESPRNLPQASNYSGYGGDAARRIHDGAVLLAQQSEDSDDTAQDSSQHITAEELAKCAAHVHSLLDRIALLQHEVERTVSPQHSRHRIHKMYRQFCRRFEADLLQYSGKPSLPLPEFAPSSLATSYNYSAFATARSNNYEHAASSFVCSPQKAFPVAPTQPQENHALQDYQMQLMLLEQQKKDRLLMARQESNSEANHAFDSTYHGQMPFGESEQYPSSLSNFAADTPPMVPSSPFIDIATQSAEGTLPAISPTGGITHGSVQHHAMQRPRGPGGRFPTKEESTSVAEPHNSSEGAEVAPAHSSLSGYDSAHAPAFQPDMTREHTTPADSHPLPAPPSAEFNDPSEITENTEIVKGPLHHQQRQRSRSSPRTSSLNGFHYLDFRDFSAISDYYNIGNAPESFGQNVPPQSDRRPKATSHSNMPSPINISAPRSPLRSPIVSPDRRASICSETAPSIRTQGRLDPDDRSSPEVTESLLSPRRGHGYKRTEDPPRHPQTGKMICKHEECANLVFDRKCEWSKHMDKHDRPYKCNLEGCEKLEGFTYSGGLLRHQREVHQMYGGTKKSLFCPFPDCKRSSGAGFTRKENLAEHVRRVHRGTTATPTEVVDSNNIPHPIIPPTSLSEPWSPPFVDPHLPSWAQKPRVSMKRYFTDEPDLPPPTSKRPRTETLENSDLAVTDAPPSTVQDTKKGSGVDASEEDIVDILLARWTTLPAPL